MYSAPGLSLIHAWRARASSLVPAPSDNFISHLRCISTANSTPVRDSSICLLLIFNATTCQRAAAHIMRGGQTLFPRFTRRVSMVPQCWHSLRRQGTPLVDQAHSQGSPRLPKSNARIRRLMQQFRELPRSARRTGIQRHHEVTASSLRPESVRSALFRDRAEREILQHRHLSAIQRRLTLSGWASAVCDSDKSSGHAPHCSTPASVDCINRL